MAIIGTDLAEAILQLNQGNLVAIPTETVYGLAGNALDAQTIARVFEVKSRPSFDPLIVHLPTIDFMNKVVVDIPAIATRLAESFWPGPLTLVLPKSDIIPDLATSGLPTVAVRVPDHPMTLELLRRLDFPLVSPSANPFGYISPTNAQHVQAQLGKLIPYILDGGDCSVGIESTIIGFEQDNPVLYRPGGLSLEELQQVAGKIAIKSSTSHTLAPGMLKSHYAPSKKMFIGNIEELMNKYDANNAGILSFKDTFSGISTDRQLQLSLTGSLREAAQNLFASLRKLDSMDIKYIFAEQVPAHGLGIAINDRLKRAAN